MKVLSFICKGILGLLTCLFLTQLYAAPQTTPLNTNWFIGVGANINGITSQDANDPNSKNFVRFKQKTSDVGFNVIAIKPISSRISMNFEYTKGGDVVTNNQASETTTNQKVTYENQYLSTYGTYAYPLSQHFGALLNLGLTYNINKAKPNAAATAAGQPVQKNESFGYVYGGGFKYTTGRFATAFTYMAPQFGTSGWVNLNFLYQL